MSEALSEIIWRGSKFGPIDIEAVDENNAPVDLTGYGVQADCRAKPGGSILFNLGPSIVSGKVRLSKTGAESWALGEGEFLFDIVLTPPGGERMPPLYPGSKVVVKTPISQPS